MGRAALVEVRSKRVLDIRDFLPTSNLPFATTATQIDNTHDLIYSRASVLRAT